MAAVTTPQGTIIPFPSFGGGGELRFAVAHRVISFAGLVDAALVRLLAR